jgi:hypothetical protein
LKITFGPKGEGIKWGWRRLFGMELYNMHSYKNFIRMTKSRMVTWKYGASILFGHAETETWVLVLAGSQEQAGSCPNKMLAL